MPCSLSRIQEIDESHLKVVSQNQLTYARYFKTDVIELLEDFSPNDYISVLIEKCNGLSTFRMELRSIADNSIIRGLTSVLPCPESCQNRKLIVNGVSLIGVGVFCANHINKVLEHGYTVELAIHLSKVEHESKLLAIPLAVDVDTGKIKFVLNDEHNAWSNISVPSKTE